MGFWVETMSDFGLGTVFYHYRLMIGVPLGIWTARSDRADKIIHPVLDLMQTMPAFVYLIPAVLFFGLGRYRRFRNGDFRHAPVVRLTDLGIRQVPADIVEATRSFGATSFQLLYKCNCHWLANDHDGSESNDHAFTFYGSDSGHDLGRRIG